MIVGLEELDPLHLPVAVAISTVTMAELAAGPHATTAALAADLPLYTRNGDDFIGVADLIDADPFALLLGMSLDHQGERTRSATLRISRH